jgi:hypothetical protein
MNDMNEIISNLQWTGKAMGPKSMRGNHLLSLTVQSAESACEQNYSNQSNMLRGEIIAFEEGGSGFRETILTRSSELLVGNMAWVTP